MPGKAISPWVGRVTSHKTTCLGSGGWIPTAGVWGVDSLSWCLGGGFPFFLLPGKAISPWEGLPATTPHDWVSRAPDIRARVSRAPDIRARVVSGSVMTGSPDGHDRLT